MAIGQLYKRSHFLSLLKTEFECDIIVIKEGVLKIVNGPASAFIHLNGKDRIEYDEVFILYKKLYLPRMIMPSELEVAD